VLVGGRMSPTSAETHSNIVPSQRRPPINQPWFSACVLARNHARGSCKEKILLLLHFFLRQEGERKCFPAAGCFLHHTEKERQVRGRFRTPVSVPKGISLSAGDTQGVVSSGTPPRATFLGSACQPPATLSQNTSISMPKVQALIFNTWPQLGKG